MIEVLIPLPSDASKGFISFGGEYPNQKFAGFIAAGSKIATDPCIAMLQGKIIGITGKIELYHGKPEIKMGDGVFQSVEGSCGVTFLTIGFSPRS
jgi:hypothetical protein